MNRVRTLHATDGQAIHELAVLRKLDGTYWLHDVTADPYADSLEQIQDAGDRSVLDALRAGEFTIGNCPAS